MLSWPVRVWRVPGRGPLRRLRRRRRCMLLIHYPADIPLPPPWQPSCEVTPVVLLDPLPRRAVARAPAGTPLPGGATLYARPAVTDEPRSAARDVLQRATHSADQLRRGPPRRAVAGPGRRHGELR